VARDAIAPVEAIFIMPTKKSPAKKATAKKTAPAKKAAPAKKSTATKKKSGSKREVIEPHAGDKRYVRRTATGKFGKTVDMGKSLASDKRSKAKKKVPKGQGDRGDTKR
jgi:hypothetical protein